MGLPKISSYQAPKIQREFLNRTTWQVDPQRAVVLVHDMQNYFMGAFAPDHEAATRASSNTARLLDVARKLRVPVYYTAQPPRQDNNHRALLADFWGPGLQTDSQAEIVPELTPAPNDTILTKWRYSAFERTRLAELMQHGGRNQLLITGIYSHIGCLTTATNAFMADIEAFMINDAQADFSLTEHEQAMNYTANRCAHVLNTNDVFEDIALHSPAQPPVHAPAPAPALEASA